MFVFRVLNSLCAIVLISLGVIVLVYVEEGLSWAGMCIVCIQPTPACSSFSYIHAYIHSSSPF